MNLLAWPVLLPLLAGAVLLPLRGWRTRLAASALAATATFAACLLIAVRAFGGEVLTVQMAGWPAPFGITLIADRLAALLLLTSSAIALLTVLLAGVWLRHSSALGHGALLDRAREAFGAQALLQFLFMGVHMSFLAGDLFNLFVAFEVMLVASYALLLLGGELPQLREGFKYVVINLTASTVFAMSAGLAYGLTGTLNLADMATRLVEHGPDARVTLLALMLTLVFATKAAAFPLGFWLPDAYPTPPAAFGAFFAALLTKVGVYALVRVHTLVFPAEALPGQVLLALGGATVLFGAWGAVARQRWRHVLAFANVASVGYVLVGAFLGTVTGLGAALYYLVHSVLAVFAAFALAALAERLAGADVRRPGHLARYPWLGVAFFVVGIALAGLPPTSGFLGKFGMVRELAVRGGPLGVWGVVTALLGGFVLLYAVTRIWQRFFWGASEAVAEVRLPAGGTGVAAVAVALVVAWTAFAGPAFEQTERAASQLLDGGAYRAAVLEAPPPPGFDPSALDEGDPEEGAP